MARKTFDEARDLRIADDASRQAQVDRALMCAANGCPNRWSADASGAGRVCSWHFHADPRDWPRITQEQQIDEHSRQAGHTVPDRPREHTQHQAPAMPTANAYAVLQAQVLARKAASALHEAAASMSTVSAAIALPAAVPMPRMSTTAPSTGGDPRDIPVEFYDEGEQ